MKKIYLIMAWLLLASSIANATIRYVDSTATGADNGSTWTDAYKYLSSAISASNAAATKDTIYIAKGTYYPTGAKSGTNRDSTFFISRGGIKIYGGYPTGGGTRNITANPTVLSGDIRSAGFSNDNSNHVIVIAGLAATADSVLVDGISVSAGYANGGGNKTYNGISVPQDNGGGIFLESNDNGAKTSIRNCSISGNYGTRGGGIYNDDSSPAIINCTFSGNNGGGAGMYNGYSSPIIINCTFSANGGAFGGGMYNYSSSPGIINCTFSGNTSAQGAGLYNYFGSPKITNCSFCNNTSTGTNTAGGVHNISCTISITNCSFYNNTATGSGSAGGVMSTGSTCIANITNSIFWGNTGSTSALGGAGTYNGGTNSISYSDVQGITASGSNINADPQFMNASAGNLQLQSCSPAINAGSNAAISGYTTDLAGATRIVNTKVDMGAYESTFSPVSLPAVMYVDSANGNDTNNGASWSTAYKTLSYALNKAQLCDVTDSILVAKGTYYPTGAKSGTNRDSTFAITRGGLKIYGGYPAGGGTRNSTANPTVASGDINTSSSTDNSYHVMVIAGLAATADSVVVDGISLSAGNANSNSSFTCGTTVIVQNNGAGIYTASNNGNTRIALRNCTFSGNTASSGGGICNDSSSPNITNCTFSGNTATYGGGMYNYSSPPGITNCTFSGNTASNSGGGICNDLSSPGITNCTFTANTASYGGGMYNQTNSSPILTNSSFTGNTASYGGGMYSYSSSPGISNCTFSGNTAGAFGGGMFDNASLSSITNCIFSSNTASSGGGINIQSSSPGITNCSFSGNSATYGGGVCSDASSSPGITNCVFAGNTASGTHTAGGISNDDGTTTITNCSFYNNTATASGSTGGVMSYSSTAITNIANSIFWGNTGSSATLGGVGASGGTNHITYSDVQGIAASGSNISTDPMFVSTTDLQLQATSPCINTGSNAAISGYSFDLAGNARIFNATVDMGAYEYQVNPTIVYVDSTAGNDANTGTSWTMAFKTLSYALQVSQQTTGIYSGVDSILVAKGTYYPTGAKSGTNRDSTFAITRGGLKIYGGYPTGGGTRNSSTNPTLASGDINTSSSTDNSYHVMVIAGLAATADSVVVDGISLSAGNANGGGSFTYGTTDIVQNNGAGMHAAANNGNTRIALRNCTFSGNAASGSGGGMWNLGSAPAIANCMFSGNTATNGGAIVNNASTPTITNCTFSGNTASGSYGGAMYNYSSSSDIAYCSFSGNTAASGAGILNLSSSSTISNSIFTGNTASSGGGIMNLSSPSTISNSIFTGNTAASSQTGGGIDNSGDTTTIINCSFYNNTATASGSAGGVMSHGSSTITNSLFWGNTGNTTALGSIGTSGSGTNNITYSDVQGISASGTNISADPLFVSTSNLQLQPCSPAINAGSNAAITGYSTDLAGNTRIIQGNVDMGAYEYQGVSPTNSTAVYVDSAAGSDANSGTSWVQAFKTLSYALAGAQACNTITDSILVAKGTYYPTGVQSGTNRDSAFLIKRGGLKIYGAYPTGGGTRNRAANPTTLSGAINTSSDADNSYHVMVIAGIGTAADSIVVDGLTLTKGYATGTGSKTYNGVSVGRTYGGGISILRDSTAQKTAIRNCTVYACNASYGAGAWVEYASPYIFKTTFDGDSALSGGGGINIKANVAGWGNPVIDSCLFSNNHSALGGGMRNESAASPTVTNCTFSGNTTIRVSASSGRGAGMYNQASTPAIMNSTFSSNTAFDGGGMFNQASSPGITNCTFSGNSAAGSGGGSGGGGGMCNNGGSSPALTNCVFSGNAAGGNGGGILNVSSSSPTVRNCTFSGNAAGGTGGLVNQASSAPTISNTIIFGNSSGVANDASSTAVITYSLVQGITTGTGNIKGSTDPLFVSPQPASAAPTTAGNYSLQPCSHALNVGRNDSIPTGITTDLASNLRIYNTTVDMGAYELQSLPAIHTYDTLKTAICNGDSLLFNGKYYKTAVSRTDSFHTVAGCDSFKTLQLSVNPRPAMPTTITPVAYCLGSTATALSATPATTGDTLKWYDATPALLGAAPTPLTSTATSITYYVSSKNSYGCEGAKKTITVTVNPTPALPTTSTPVVYCLGATATALTATPATTGDTLKWYDATPTLLSAAPTPATTTATSMTYYVSGKNSYGCEGAKKTITVTINPTPALPTTSTPVLYCLGATATALSATPASTGDTLKWYDATPTLLGAAPTPATTTTTSTTYYVSGKNSYGCEGTKKTIIVTVNPTPALPATTTPVIYCQGATAAALTATPATAGDTLKWYNATPTLLGAAPTPLTTTATSITYYVSGKNSYGCEGAKKTITVTINPSPALPTTTTPVIYCQGATATALTATPASSGDTLKWYDATPTLLGTAPTPATTTAMSMIYYVSGKNSYGCEGSKASITVNINPPPAAPLVATPLNLCKDGPSGPLTASGSNLKWYTTVTGGSGVSSITPATGTLGSTDYFVSQSSAASLGSCEGPRSTLTVVVNPLPAVAISSLSPYGFIFCRGLGVTLKSIAPTAMYWQWDKAGLSIPGATADNIKADTQTFWGLTVTDIYGCKNQAKVFVYKDSALPPVLTPASLVLCEENSGLMTCSPGFSTYSFKWMKDGVPVTPVTTKENLKNTIGKGVYSVIVTNNVGCIDTTNNCVATNYPRPAKPTIINADPLLSVAAIYRYYQWYKNGKSIPGANSVKYTVPGPGQYSVQITDENGCLNESDTIEILAPNNIQKQLQHVNIKIYPNPTHDVVNIDAPISVNASVFDLLGKQVFSGKNVTHISLQAFADGTYVLYISDQDGNYIGTEKMIKMTQ